MSEIHEVATGGDDRFARLACSVGQDAHARVWVADLRSGDLNGPFPIRYEFGGQRLAVSSCGSCFVTAQWHRGGVWCYDASTGEELWAITSGFSKVQHLASLSGNLMACVLERGCVHVVSVADGSVVRTYPNTAFIASDPSGVAVFRRKHAEKPVGTGLGRLRVDGLESPVRVPDSPVLAAAFDGDSVVLGAMDGTITCVSGGPGGTERWRVSLGPERLVELAHSTAAGCFLGLLSDGNSVVRIDPNNGEVHQLAELPYAQSRCFSLNAEVMFSSDGRVVSTRDWRVVTAFDFENRDLAS